MKKNTIVNIDSKSFSNKRFNNKNFEKLDFANAIHSIKCKEEKFTNFICNTGEENFKRLKEIYLSDNPLQILFKEFEEKGVYDYSKKNKSDVGRLFRIFIKAGAGFLFFSDCKDIIRYKNRDYPEFQLYFRKKGLKITLLLIDFYHLGLIAPNHKTNKCDSKEKYDGVYNKYKQCISCIKKSEV